MKRQPTDATITTTAVALAYHSGDVAPRVVARGSGLVAEEIIRRARDAGVFIHESGDLVRLLAKVDLDAHIPPQLYSAIAEILAWLYNLEAEANAASAQFVVPATPNVPHPNRPQS